MSAKIRNKNLILPELSYTIVGALLESFHEVGAGLKERYYYPAIQKALEKRGLRVKPQAHIPVQFLDSKLADQYIDFIVEDKVVLEIKVNTRFRKPDYDQVKMYLTITNCPLGILARFDSDGVTFHRVLNPHNH